MILLGLVFFSDSGHFAHLGSFVKFLGAFSMWISWDYFVAIYRPHVAILPIVVCWLSNWEAICLVGLIHSYCVLTSRQG